MPQREFANQKRLMEYAEQNGLAYLWDGTPAFVKWRRRLSHEEYEIVKCAYLSRREAGDVIPKGTLAMYLRTAKGTRPHRAADHANDGRRGHRVAAAKLAAVLAGESPANRGVQTLL